MPYRHVCADKVYFVALGPNYSLRAEAFIERSSEPLGRNRYRKTPFPTGIIDDATCPVIRVALASLQD